MPRLLDFYHEVGTDCEKRFLGGVLAWDGKILEEVHDFIQWLFPIPEASQFNFKAPVLTEDDSKAFNNDSRLRDNLRKSFQRILRFLGLTLTPDGEVVKGENFAERLADVWAAPNHNWLRITRILRSLKLLGLETMPKLSMRVWPCITQATDSRFPRTFFDTGRMPGSKHGEFVASRSSESFFLD